MRIVGVTAALAVMAVALPAAAQTAEFKCPAGTVTVDFGSIGQIVWLSRDGNACTRRAQSSAGQLPQNWYAPTFVARTDRSLAWIDANKPWTLWPLTVGKKMNGRFDGVGSDANSTGSWAETTVVEKYEKVTVKAGTFDAFVVSRQEESLSSNYKGTYRDWYAPSLGVTVKSTYSDNFGRSNTYEAVSIKQ